MPYITPLRALKYIIHLATYLEQFDVSGESSSANDVKFSNDGKKMYVLDGTSLIYQYSLSVGFDLSTASYDSVTLNVSAEVGVSNPRVMEFNDDGSSLYVTSGLNGGIFQYTLSTEFDLSTASYASLTYNPSELGAVEGLAFNSDGSKAYMMNGSVYQYSLGTDYDISTASYDSVSFAVSGQDATQAGLEFSADGTKMFVLGSGNDEVYQYTLSTAFDVSTASYDSVLTDASSQDSAPTGFTFKPDGAEMFIIGQTNDTVYKYQTGFLIPA